MKKIGLMLILMIASMGAYAGSGDVITPDFATSQWTTTHWVYDKDLNIIVCPRGATYSKIASTTCLDEKGNKAWIDMKQAVPSGKKFVGFKITITDRWEYVSIYWK
jgi:hypothetical protein